MREFDAQQRGLQLVEPRIEAFEFVVVLGARAVVAPGPELVGQLRVVGGDGAAVAQRAQVFAGVKTEARRVAQIAGTSAFVARPVRLRGVFDDFEVMLARDGVNGVHVGRLPIQMYGDDGAGARRDGRRKARWIQVVSGGQRLHRHRFGTGLRHRQPGGNVGVGRHDDLVARANAVAPQNQMQRVKPVAHAHAMAGAAVSGKFGLERLYLGTQNVVASGEHTVKRRLQLALERQVHGLEVKKRDFHAPALTAARKAS